MQNQAHRVVKDIQKYMKALDAMMQASKSLGDSIKTVYEPDWPGSNAAYGFTAILNPRLLAKSIPPYFFWPT